VAVVVGVITAIVLLVRALVVEDDLELAERAGGRAGEVLMSYFGEAAEGLD
jgi:hypothetical protein